MSDMTLQEALQTPEVQTFLGGLIQEAVDAALPDAVKAAVDEQMPALRESVREEIAADGELEVLHREATTLIESAKGLTPTAKANLLADYSLAEEDGKPKPGRGLALIEAVHDGEGKVTKTAKAVLRESVEADVQRTRLALRESAPAVPFAPGGGSDGATAATEPPPSRFAAKMSEKGMDPTQFGHPKPEPAAAT